MRRYLLRRGGIGLVQILVVATAVFWLAEALPGDAAVVAAGDDPDPARIALIREQLGLDEPASQRYLSWLTGLATGDLGSSLRTGQPVTELLAPALGPTVVLAVVTLAVLLPLALTLGVTAAVRADGWYDRAVSTTTVALNAVPEFALAVLLVAVFALQLGVLPATAVGATGSSLLAEPSLLALPVAVLLCRSLCALTRLVRAGMVDALDAEYVAYARRHGVTGGRLLLRHALPNALPPAVQQLARTADWLIGGIIVVEAVFAVPGVSSVLVTAVSTRDIPVVQALAVLFAVVTVAVNLLADLVCHRLAPRSAVVT
ncbi:ABC transporter permease [Natronosporangium hydrolyticum]|uniref:ABC transporter permease n=1 Tax=Natronosporangium hydrolyticum TaxID=2811111 RepID=A0A895YB26_9ACTN|nr:ABC transporter permease [Natronosporangium hydrolyticum]QSB14611.1 ABC transporter permease [Natronosporangium hydrolyticum]